VGGGGGRVSLREGYKRKKKKREKQKSLKLIDLQKKTVMSSSCSFSSIYLFLGNI
jgi:hypothetical protein